MRFFDLHCDTVTRLCKIQQSLFDGDAQVNLKKAAEIEEWIQVYAIFVPDHLRGIAAWEYYCKNLAYYRDQLQQYSDWIAEMPQTGKRCTGILAVESGAVLGGNLDRITTLQQDDVRLLTLTWNGANELGCGVSENQGLTAVGKAAIPELEQRGIIVDVSHLSDAGFADVAAIAEKPFIASHSNCRAVCNHPRNLEDWQIQEIIRRKGLIGLNFHQPFVGEGNTLKSLMQHLEHILSLGGEDVVAIGSDFDGAEIDFSLNSIEKIAILYDTMIKWSYSADLAEKVLFINARNFWKR